MQRDNDEIDDQLRALRNSVINSSLSSNEIEQIINIRRIENGKQIKKTINHEIVALIISLLALIITAGFVKVKYLSYNKELIMYGIFLLIGLYLLGCLWLFIKVLRVPLTLSKNDNLVNYQKKLSVVFNRSLNGYLWASNVTFISLCALVSFGLLSVNIYSKITIIAASFLIIPINKWYIKMRFRRSLAFTR